MKDDGYTIGHAKTRELAVALAIDTWDGESDIVVHNEDGTVDYVITAYEIDAFMKRKDKPI